MQKFNIDIEFDEFDALSPFSETDSEVLARKPKFVIDDDNRADWAIRKITAERSEYERLKAIADEQITEITAMLEDAKNHTDRRTAYLTECLQLYFATVPHHTTKTTESYKLLSGTLKLRLTPPQYDIDNEKLTEWLAAREDGKQYLQTKVTAKWGELKKTLDLSSDKPKTADGTEVPGITVTPGESKFEVIV